MTSTTFYEKLKFNSGTIRLLMMTGVTKLTKLSVFSGLKHLTDLTMDPLWYNTRQTRGIPEC